MDGTGGIISNAKICPKCGSTMDFVDLPNNLGCGFVCNNPKCTSTPEEREEEMMSEMYDDVDVEE